MPDIYGPTGEKHNFPDGTPLAQMQAFMASRYGGPSATRGADEPEAAPVGQPLTGNAGYLPPGTTASRMQPQVHAPDANMVPLSEEGQRAQRLLAMKAFTGDRSGVMGAMDMLKADPTYQAREKQAHKMGEDAATLSSKQAAGTRVYSAMNELEQKSRAWLDHAPSAFNAATGEYWSNPYVQFTTGWANQGGQAFHRLLSHDIAKLTALYREMPSSGKGSGSDAQDANFKEAMGEFMKAKTPEQYFAIMQSAKQLIRDKAGLPHDFDLPYSSLHPADVLAVNQYASVPMKDDSPYITGKRPEAQRPRQQFRNKSTGALETFEHDGGKWVKVP